MSVKGQGSYRVDAWIGDHGSKPASLRANAGHGNISPLRWDPCDCKCSGTLHCSGELGVLSPDGTQLTSGSWDKTVHVWAVVSDTQLYELKGHTDGVSSLTQSVGRTFSYRARHVKQGPLQCI